tara:strand:+ start:370 stop:702 length:333 start_codon:yes stop_codon:yes gene_type:complete
METKEDFLRGDKWESRWEANKLDAMDACVTEADNIVMEVEHIVGDLDQRLDVQNTRILAKAIDQLEELIEYRYFDPHDDEPYDYTFKKQIVDICQERLSFELILKGDRNG